MIQASQLIANLDGRASARQILKDAPVGSAYMARYRLLNETITHFYDSRFRLHQDNLWAQVGIQQFAGIKNNSHFTVVCELREIHNALEVLPAEPDPESESSCNKCTKHLDQLAECRSNFTQLTKESIELNNSRFWWRFFAIAVILIIALAKLGQWWSL